MTKLLVIFLAGVALAAGAAAQVTEPEIVVTAKVEQAGLALGRDAGRQTTCSLTRSSGDRAIDHAMCVRASRCMKRQEVERTVLDECLARQKKALIAAWLRGETS